MKDIVTGKEIATSQTHPDREGKISSHSSHTQREAGTRFLHFHKFFVAGIDGVKVDCQAGVGLVGSELGGGPALAAQYQAALERSVAQHFRDNHVINCMCHSTENLYRQDIPSSSYLHLGSLLHQEAMDGQHFCHSYVLFAPERFLWLFFGVEAGHTV